MDLKEQEILGDQVNTHWYYRAKSAAMLRFLEDGPITSILDVGAGSGFFSRYLLDHTMARDAICVDPNYAREHEERHHGKPLRFVHRVGSFDGDVVLMMDVLEHVADDTALLRDYADSMKPGARVLVTVPAHAWMWSSHDVFLEHYRRYTIWQVESLVARAGLHLLRSSYYFGSALPLAATLRIGRRLNPFHVDRPGSDMRPHGRAINQFLLTLTRAELPLLGRNRIAGLSVFALARK